MISSPDQVLLGKALRFQGETEKTVDEQARKSPKKPRNQPFLSAQPSKGPPRVKREHSFWNAHGNPFVATITSAPRVAEHHSSFCQNM